jgi:WD40 repeat protein
MVQAFDLDARAGTKPAAPEPSTVPSPVQLTGVPDARPAAIAVAMRSDGPVAAIGRVDGTVNLWRLGDRDDKHLLLGHGGAITSVAFDDTGSWLATASADGTVRVWDAGTQDCITKLTPRPDRMPATLVAFSPGEKPALLSASEGGDLFVWALFSSIPSHAEIQKRLGPWRPLE